MILAILITLVLFLLNLSLGGIDRFWVFLPIHCDVPAALFTFLGLFGYTAYKGRKPFFAGLSAVFRKPKEPNAEIAQYFQQLTQFTLFWGVLGMALGMIWALAWVRLPNIIGTPVACSVFSFMYSGWIAVLLFWPIAMRFSAHPLSAHPDPSATVFPEGEGNTTNLLENSTLHSPLSTLRFPIIATLLAIAAFFLIRALMAILLVCLFNTKAYPGVEKNLGDVEMVLWQTFLTINPGDNIQWEYYLNPVFYWDVPSFIVIVLGLVAFRLAVGKTNGISHSRFTYVPVSIFLGLLWTLEGFTMMLCDLDPDMYGAGTMVSLLTAFYGFLAAVFFAIGSWRLVGLVFIPLLSTVLAAVSVGCLWGLGELFQEQRWDIYTGLLGATLIVVGIMAGLCFIASLVAYLRLLWDSGKKVVMALRAKPDEPLTEEEAQAKQIIDDAVKRRSEPRP